MFNSQYFFIFLFQVSNSCMAFIPSKTTYKLQTYFVSMNKKMNILDYEAVFFTLFLLIDI